MDISVHNISLDSFRVLDRYLKPKLEHQTSNFLHLLVYIYIYICRCEIIFFNITFRWTLDINSNHSFHSRIRILLLFLLSCKISFLFHYSHKRIKHLRDCIQNNLLVQLVVQLLRNLFQFALFFARFQKKEKKRTCSCLTVENPTRVREILTVQAPEEGQIEIVIHGEIWPRVSPTARACVHGFKWAFTARSTRKGSKASYRVTD